MRRAATPRSARGPWPGRRRRSWRGPRGTPRRPPPLHMSKTQSRPSSRAWRRLRATRSRISSAGTEFFERRTPGPGTPPRDAPAPPRVQTGRPSTRTRRRTCRAARTSNSRRACSRAWATRARAIRRRGLCLFRRHLLAGDGQLQAAALDVPVFDLYYFAVAVVSGALAGEGSDPDLPGTSGCAASGSTGRPPPRLRQHPSKLLDLALLDALRELRHQPRRRQPRRLRRQPRRPAARP